MNNEIEISDGDFPEDARLKVISWTAALIAGGVFWLLVYRLIFCTFLA